MRRLAAVDRPDRRLTKLEEITLKYTGEAPPLVEVLALRCGADETDTLTLSIGDSSVNLTAEEAEQLGWALYWLALNSDQRDPAGDLAVVVVR